METEKETSSHARSSPWLPFLLGILASGFILRFMSKREGRQINPRINPQSNADKQQGYIPVVTPNSPPNPVPPTQCNYQPTKSDTWQKIASLAQALVALITLVLVLINRSQLKLSIRQFQATQNWTEFAMRPYVTLEQVQFLEHPTANGKDIGVLGKYINTGVTPAVDVTCIDCEMIVKDGKSIIKRWPQPKYVIGIGGKSDRKLVFSSEETLSPNGVSLLDSVGSLEIIIQGRLTYRNVYDNTLYTERSFCYSWAKGNVGDNFGWCGSPRLKHIKQPKD